VREVAVAVAQVGIGEVVVAHEGQRIGRDVLVGDAEHGAAVAFELALGVLEQGGLDLARFTPRRPEVQHDDLASERGQRGVVAPVEHRQHVGGFRCPRVPPLSYLLVERAAGRLR
jgi:hypothetical protein